MAVTGLFESLALKGGTKFATAVIDWSKGNEAERLVKSLKRKHRAAPALLVQPDCVLELLIFATTGEFNRERMLAAVSEIERDLDAANALVDAIESDQWRTKRDDELVHFEIAKLRFDVRLELNAVRETLLERLEQVGPRTAGIPTVSPRQLPRIPASFTNRDAERERLVAGLGVDGEGASARVVEICGMPGVGKSMLAVRVGHDVSGSYPDGQLYENLRAADGTVVALGDALANLLRALGVAEETMPAGDEARAALLRTQLASRSVLLLLDNVPATAPRIATLIPAASGCGVIVTAPAPLSGLEPDERVALDVFAGADALLLLERLLGERRVAEERAAAEELLACCAWLPLAMHAMACWLGRSPRLTLAAACKRMRTGDLDHTVRQAFSLPYERLTTHAASLFRMFGAVRAPIVSPELASALAGDDQQRAEYLIDEIIEAGLAEREADGVRLHELTHRFAAERLRAEPGEPALASERLAAWMLTEGERRALALRTSRHRDG